MHRNCGNDACRGCDVHAVDEVLAAWNLHCAAMASLNSCDCKTGHLPPLFPCHSRFNFLVVVTANL